MAESEDKSLYWVFTDWGKYRLTRMKAGEKLFLYHAAVGSYNWYEDPDGKLGGPYSKSNFKLYFNPHGSQPEGDISKTLGSIIKGDATTEYANGMIPINSKILNNELDDNGNVTSRIVTLSFTIPEKFAVDEVDIKEVGIYDNYNGEERLFAVCAMQGIHKPNDGTNHYIAIQIDTKLKSEALADWYEDIVLDPNNNFVTVEELGAFEENLLFVESNLAEQISNNSKIIGYNRPQQLYEKIQEDKEKYSNFAVSTTYSNLLTATTIDKIKCFWVFKPNNDTSGQVSIADLSYYSRYLATDKNVNLYESGYEGLAPWINFRYNSSSNTGNYYSYNIETNDFDFIDENGDAKFTLFFIGAQNSNDHINTIIAKDNSGQTVEEEPSYKISITPQRQVSIKFYENRNKYVEYITAQNSVPEAGKFYVTTITYDPVIDDINNELIPRFKVTINGKEVSGNINRSSEGYDGMHHSALPLLSRVVGVNDYEDYVDSKMCLISLVKGELGEDYIRAITYNMMALIGVNPCLVQ